MATIALILGVSAAGPAVGESAPNGGEQQIVVPGDLHWSEVTSMEEGALMAVLEGDLSEEAPFTVRLKLPDGYVLPPHTHPEYERVTVLSGTLHFAHGDTFDRDATTALPPGGFARMPPGVPMFGYAEGETIVQLHGTGPWGIEYLDPQDDPRKD